MPLFAASLESLIAFVLIVLASAVANWVKQRQARKEAEAEPRAPGEPSPPAIPGAPPSRPRPVFDLEEELRRLLGEEERPAPPPPLPPPVVAKTEPTPAPAPKPASPPVPAATAIEPEPELKPMALPAGTHFPRGPIDLQEAPAFQLASLTESARAYQRASGIDQVALARLEAARSRTDQPQPLSVSRPSRGVAPEVAAMIANFRQPRTARQAVVASVVLGPPKSLEA